MSAAIRFPTTAGYTGLAIEIRLNRTTIPWGEFGHAVTESDDLDSELMAKNPWIAKKRLPATIGVDVGPTDSDSMNPDKNLAGRGKCGYRSIDQAEAPGFFKSKGYHDWQWINCFEEDPMASSGCAPVVEFPLHPGVIRD